MLTIQWRCCSSAPQAVLRAGAFLADAFLVAFLVAAFFAGAFLVAFLAAAFFAGDFFAAFLLVVFDADVEPAAASSALASVVPSACARLARRASIRSMTFESPS